MLRVVGAVARGAGLALEDTAPGVSAQAYCTARATKWEIRIGHEAGRTLVHGW